MTPGTKCQRSAAHREKHASRTGTHKLKVREKSQSRYELAPSQHAGCFGACCAACRLLLSMPAPSQHVGLHAGPFSACRLKHAGLSMLAKACCSKHAGLGMLAWACCSKHAGAGMLASACWLHAGAGMLAPCELHLGLSMRAPSWLLQSIHMSKLCVDLTTWL